MRLTILSRASHLARLQAALVERALRAADPSLDLALVTRKSAGDRDQSSPLWQMADKGAFTADLSAALVEGAADMVVHSWKDLPLDPPAGARVAATLERADPRDVLLLRRSAIEERPSALTVLSSSPRRAWLLDTVVPGLLPWKVDAITAATVRGNIDTRLRKLVEGEAHGLVMAKAALDRLLGFGAPFDEAAGAIRQHLERCHAMVLPMREAPWAPAQGALAVEIAAGRSDVAALLEAVNHGPTWRAVTREREALRQRGGGCHQALGAAVIERDFGVVSSVRARGEGGADEESWTLERRSATVMPRTTADRMWPGPNDRPTSIRRAVAAPRPDARLGLWVARAEALPEDWTVAPDTPVWTAGSRTWCRLAARGVWVHGCADGLGDDRPPLDTLFGRPIEWLRLTHTGAAAPGSLATYAVETELPDDLPSRTHLFWTSGTLFSRALELWPDLRRAWHASGPGRTREVIETTLGPEGRFGVWLDRESWENELCQ